MKTIHAVVLVLVVSVLFFASAKPVSAGQHSRHRDEIFANSLADGGSIRMKHSPALGINIPIAIRIDGREAGAFAKGHVYERFLTPGRHKLHASRPRQVTDSWNSYIDVRRGETYSFVVYCNPNRVILQPVGRVE